MHHPDTIFLVAREHQHERRAAAARERLVRRPARPGAPQPRRLAAAFPLVRRRPTATPRPNEIAT